MKKHFDRAIKNPLLSGSAVIFAGSLLASLFNFFFNLFMSRNLTVVEYGTLVSLISIMTIFSLPAGAAVPSIVKFAASYFAKGEFDMVRGLFIKMIKPFVFFGLLIFIIFLIFASEIGQFFKIDNKFLIIMAGLNVLISYIGIINAPLLQAKLAFTFMTLMNLVGAVLRLSSGIVAVFVGRSVESVIWALSFSSLVPYFLSFIPLKFIFNKDLAIPKIATGDLISYGTPAAIALFGLTSFITLDIILVKHFFDPLNAGIYSGLSLVGRVIFFFTAPVGTVMFPLMIQKHVKKEPYHNDFKLVLLMILFPSIGITIFYFLFPQFSIQFFLKAKEYSVIAPLLGLFGIYMTVYSLLFMVTNFYLSINKTKVFIPIIIGAALQIVLIWFYHDSFMEIIIISLVIISLLLIALLLYYYVKLYDKNKRYYDDWSKRKWRYDKDLVFKVNVR